MKITLVHQHVPADAPADERDVLDQVEAIGHQALVDAVRDVGAKNVVIVGGLDWAYDLTGKCHKGGLSRTDITQQNRGAIQNHAMLEVANSTSTTTTTRPARRAGSMSSRRTRTCSDG